MRGLSLSTAVSAALVLLSPVVNAEPHSPHASMARRHMHGHSKKNVFAKRSQCEFPTDAGLVAVTPGAENAGWAMSPDQPCKPGMYCPYACPPGQLMAQWDPQATTYSYPASMNGGLYCNEDGEIEKPFPKKPYCYDGTGTFACKNKAGGQVAICQTVLPGNEAMLIPTLVTSSAVLAVPDTSYWAKTAAHFYINPPGVSAEEACVWGTKDKPVGNWSPYVAGANELDNGETFVKIGWNPIYIEPDVPFRNVVPDWGVKIECTGGKCGGLPCYIDPAEHGVNEVSQMKGAGAGGANFCVVSVPKGAQATLVVFSKSGGSSSDTASSSKKATPSSTTSSSTTATTASTTTTSSANKPSTTKSSSSSSSNSSDTSSSSEPSRTTKPSSSVATETDSKSSSSKAEPTETGSSSSDDDNEEDNEDDTEENTEEDDDSYSNNAAELYAVDETSTESAPQTTSSSYTDQAVGAGSNNNDAAIDASPNVGSTVPTSNSGVSLSLSGASAVLICSVFTILVIAL